MRRALFVVTVVLAACTGGQQGPSPATPGSVTPEARKILDELNQWCAHGDDCDVAMRPDNYPGRVAAGETNGWISSHRDRLAALGVTVTWWPSSPWQFVPQQEADVRIIIGGHFAPDHLGPDKYEAIRQRALANAELYLDTLVELVGTNPQSLSSNFAPDMIAMLHDAAPDAARDTARQLLPRYQAALKASTPAPADDEYRAERLRRSVEALERLAR